MDPLRWQRIGALFAAASRLDSERRIAFLKDNCGQDQDLFEQLKSLLDIDDRHGVLDTTPTVSTLGIPEIVAGRFRIIRRIGEGGMGTVYEAEDLQLHDHVALKTIRPEIASDHRAVERFRQEIRLGKRVTHPNICRIYDLGTDRSENGSEFLFLTMQFLAGETLSARIWRGPMPESEALPLIEDMADALSAAHQAEVIHRDFKSGNVILVPCARRTCAVVTDFGLARGINDGASLTRSGPVGTVDYMAPEQIIGGEITPATDIYALGVVMYEMVTGQLPFTRDYQGTVLQKHLNDEPRPPRDLVPQLDANWNEAILRCLKKLPGDRFQSGAELKAAVAVKPSMRTKSLRRLWPPPRSGGTRNWFWRPRIIVIWIAVPVFLLACVYGGYRLREEWSNPHRSANTLLTVLPFESAGQDEKTNALILGLTETLTARLSEASGTDLQLISERDIREQGVRTAEQAWREFGSDLVLEGSAHTVGDQIRVTCSLVDSKTHRQLAARTITGDIKDAFEFEDQVSNEITALLAAERGIRTHWSPIARRETNREAYASYLRGRGYLSDYHKLENIELAIAELRSAVTLDPAFPEPYAVLGDAYLLGYQEANRGSDWVDQARQTCQKSLSTGETAEGHICLGGVYNLNGKYDLALEEFQRAVQIDTNDEEGLRGEADAYTRLGNFASAEAAYQKAIVLRPNYWGVYSWLGAFYYSQARYGDAITQFKKVIELAPVNYRGYSNLGGMYVALGKYAEALDFLNKSIEIRPNLEAFNNLGNAYFQLRRFSDAAGAFQRGLTLDDSDWLLWGNLGDSLFWSGRHSQALSAYDKAIVRAEDKLKVNPKDTLVLAFLADYNAMSQNHQKAIEEIDQALALAPMDGEVRLRAAVVYNQLGDTDRCLASLEKAVSIGYSAHTIRDTPDFDHLHDNPRFRALGRSN